MIDSMIDYVSERRSLKLAFAAGMAVYLFFTFLSFRDLHASIQRESQGRARFSAAAEAALRDPSFVDRARTAGYRLKLSLVSDDIIPYSVIEASCARADTVGPLPCDPYPYHPSDPEALVRVRP